MNGGVSAPACAVVHGSCIGLSQALQLKVKPSISIASLSGIATGTSPIRTGVDRPTGELVGASQSDMSSNVPCAGSRGSFSVGGAHLADAVGIISVSDSPSFPPATSAWLNWPGLGKSTMVPAEPGWSREATVWKIRVFNSEPTRAFDEVLIAFAASPTVFSERLASRPFSEGAAPSRSLVGSSVAILEETGASGGFASKGSKVGI